MTDGIDEDTASRFNDAVRDLGRSHRLGTAYRLAPLGLSLGQELVLLVLAERGTCSPGEIAQATGTEPPTVTVAVRRLEEQGLLRREACPHDRRRHWLRLTPAGSALVPRVRAARRDLARTMLDGMTPVEADHLIELLDRLAARGAAPRDPCAGPGCPDPD